MVARAIGLVLSVALVGPAAVGQAVGPEGAPNGLSDADWSSIRDANLAGRHRIATTGVAARRSP
jgi:hypothetical protein